MTKVVNVNTANGKMNLDIHKQYLPAEDYVDARNYIKNDTDNGDYGVGGTIEANKLISYIQPSGVNKVIGTAKYEKENASIEFVYNDQGDHQIRMVKDETVSLVLEASFLNFDPKFRIINARVNDDFLIWTDNNNEPRYMNILWALRLYSYTRGLSGGVLYDFNEMILKPPAVGDVFTYKGNVWLYTGPDPIGNIFEPPVGAPGEPYLLRGIKEESYYEINNETILTIAKPPVQQIFSEYDSDIDFNSNNLYGSLFKFAYRYKYLDGRKSVWSIQSSVPFPQNEETELGDRLDVQFNNVMRISINTGSRDVSEIDIGFVNVSDQTSFKIITTLKKYDKQGDLNTIEGQLAISDITIIYTGFYNNEQYIPEDFSNYLKPFHYVPRKAFSQEILNDGRVIYGNIEEGMSDVVPDITASTEIRDVEILAPSSVVINTTTGSFTDETGFGGTMTKYQFDFNGNFRDGLFFDYEIVFETIRRTSPTTTIRETLVSENISLLLPYNKNKSQTQNIEAAMDFIAKEIRDITSEAFVKRWPGYSLKFPFQYYPGFYPGDPNADVNQTTSSLRTNYFYNPSLLPFTTSSDSIFVVRSTETNAYPLDQNNPLVIYYFIDINNATIRDSINARFESLKTSGRVNLGVVYSDKSLRSGGVTAITSLDTPNIDYGASSDVNNYAFKTIFPKININHIPPQEADYYQFVISENTFVSDYIQYSIEAVTTADGLSRIEVNDLITTNSELNKNSILETWTFIPGDRIKLIAKKTFVSDSDYVYDELFDLEILNYLDASDQFIIKDPTPIVPARGDIIEIYRPKKGVDQNVDIYFEIGPLFPILNPHTDNRAHAGDIDQVVSSGISTQPSEVILEYGNCFIKIRNAVYDPLKAYRFVAEDPNYSDFYTSDFYDNGRPKAVLLNQNVERRTTKLRFGGTFDQSSNVNNISNFTFEDFSELSTNYGDIQALGSIGYTLQVIQNFKITHFYINRSILKEADDGSQIVLSDRVLNNKVVSDFDYGTINPESVIIKNTHMLFYDANNRVFVRSAKNGIFPISDYGVSKFTKDLSVEILKRKDFSNRPLVLAVYDERKEMFIWSARYKDTDDDLINDWIGDSISFDNRSNSWVSFYDFFIESGNEKTFIDSFGSDNIRMYTYLNGEAWVHDDNTNYNELYGVKRTCSVAVVANKEKDFNKVWDALSVQSEVEWLSPEIGDVDVDDGQMKSRILKLRKKENIYHGDFKRDALSPGSKTQDEKIVYGRRLRGKYILVNLKTDSNNKVVLKEVIIKGTISERAI
jgi:hypothetical protein